MELINTIGTRVKVRDEHVARLLDAGYRHPETEPKPRPTRTGRKVTRAGGRTP